MAILFDGVRIPGTFEAPVAAPPDVQVKTTQYFGLIGESELSGGRKGRDIAILITLHDGYTTLDKLRTARAQLDRLVGRIGKLRVGNINTGFLESYEDCSFRGFTPAGEPEGRSGPLRDEAGTLKLENGRQDGGWWIRGTLRFRQLGVR